jgi:Nucleotide modification associated domain 2
MIVIYIYKLTSHNGAAPCDEDWLLSLAICMPILRRVIKEGDWIIGVGGVYYGEELIYIAEVTKKLGIREYYRPSTPFDRNPYENRADCIDEDDTASRPLSSRSALIPPPRVKANAIHHHNQRGTSANDLDSLSKDVGLLREKSYTALSTNYRVFFKPTYLGENINPYPREYKTLYPGIAALVRGIGGKKSKNYRKLKPDHPLYEEASELIEASGLTPFGSKNAVLLRRD